MVTVRLVPAPFRLYSIISQLPATRCGHYRTLHLNLCGKVVLRPNRLQGRFGVTDTFGRRIDNVEYDPGRHDAVNDGLQPVNKDKLSLTAFRFDESEGLTAFPLVGAEATDKRVAMSVMALPRQAKSPRAYRNLNNEADIQGPEDYWNRVSGCSSDADHTHLTSTQSIKSLLPGVSRGTRSTDMQRDNTIILECGQQRGPSMTRDRTV